MTWLLSETIQYYAINFFMNLQQEKVKSCKKGNLEKLPHIRRCYLGCGKTVACLSLARVHRLIEEKQMLSSHGPESAMA